MRCRDRRQRSGFMSAWGAVFLLALLSLVCVAMRHVDAMTIGGGEQNRQLTDAPTMQSPLSPSVPYLIGPEDQLNIKVRGDETLTREVTVSPGGSIQYPLLGAISAAGMTPEGLAKVIRDGLGQGFLKDPYVEVDVTQFNSKRIMVFGLVGSPGVYRVKGQTRLLELLFKVGGAKNESGNRIVILRKDESKPDSEPVPVTEFLLDDLLLEGDLSKNILVEPGDYVYVTASAPDKRRYYVMGEVRNPGPTDYSRPITLLEAIKLAGGVTQYASTRKVKIIRKEGDTKNTLLINLKDIEKGKREDNFYIQPGDVVIVPESWF
jgi:polysaccharide biosynthesis/export protein